MADTSLVAGSLVRIHKIISRGLSVALKQCDAYLGERGMPPEERGGFLMFVTTLKGILHGHHLTEDELAFPFFRDRVEAPYARLQDDHRVMARMLVELERCLPDVPSSGVGRLRETLGGLEALWGPHIGIEEERLTAETVNRVAGPREQVSLVKQFEEHSKKHAGPGPLALPFYIYNLDGADREAFLAPVPWIVKKVLVPIVWRGQWKPMKPLLLCNPGNADRLVNKPK